MLNVENESPLSKDIMRVKSFFPIYACKQVSATAIGLYFICSTFTFLTMDKRAYGRKPPSLRSKNLTSSIEVEPFQESLVDINETVFFLETQESLDELDRSLMCAVESYHGANPFDSIVVLINGGGSIPIVPDYLKDVSQIQFRHLSFAHFLEASPLGELWNSPKWKETIYPLNHMSDLLRVVILHKFGGTYIDSDLIALKAFPRLANNNVIVGVETEKVGSAYMKFGKNHAFLEQAIVELFDNYSVWSEPHWSILDIEVKNDFQNVHPDLTSLNPRPELIIPYEYEPTETINTSILIFNKNRKSGSSTVRNWIKVLAPKNRFHMIKSGQTRLPNFPYSMSIGREQEFVDQIKRSPRPLVFMEHFYFVDFRRYDPQLNPTWLNLVREPISRFASLFYHQRKMKIWKGKQKPPEGWFRKNISECVLNDDPECSIKKGYYREQQLTYFCGNALECREVGNLKALALAKLNIESHFPVVGVLELFNETLVALELLLPRFFRGIRQHLATSQSLFQANANPHPDVEHQALLKIQRVLALDQDLYEFVKQRLTKQVSELFRSKKLLKNISTSVSP
ncbi:hypothetical protein TCAL_10235 [Tigriopus californicus]|uniref:Alpha-1,4-N-acetylglucosaminyltransferase n=1 Tax=Tigriopus californicus TaxID=6832 RepID=A0A553NSJ0_TIGCA|nr:hypothetical protein TCAL_10235 [Tigriopus californicus]